MVLMVGQSHHGTVSCGRDGKAGRQERESESEKDQAVAHEADRHELGGWVASLRGVGGEGGTCAVLR